jgi:beta-lactamase superfamily II metal-dependent hydrolase
MDFELEFMPVGDASKAGDAIVARYGINGSYEVTIIDGGTEEAGADLVAHVKQHCGANTVVKHVVSTHPDGDHASGLRTVLKELQVENLWVHGLWYHTRDFLQFFSNKSLTVDGVTRTIKAEYPVIDELITLAHARGTRIYEPFQGSVIGPFRVLSPTRYAYDRLVSQFRRTPDPDIELLKSQRMYLGEVKKQSRFSLFVERAVERAVSLVSERWDLELLREGGVTSAENETSTVLWGDFGSGRVLLTGDSGVNALRWACDYAQSIDINIQSATLVQVPHHGSRRNVSPSVLDRILGARVPHGSAETRYGIVSAPKDDENHPRKVVMNAFLRRGTGVRRTQGQRYRYHSGTMPPRAGEVLAVPFGFFERVEAYD